MWWLFSNKKRDDSGIHTYHLLSKIKTIENNLKNSFFNIKKDISKINSSVYHHDNTIAHLKERVLLLESHLQNIKPQKESKVEKENEYYVDLPKIQENKKSILTVKWEDLTNIQQNILLRLGLLQIESTQKKIAMKHLAEELYPEKEYNDVRSMFSDYINLLNEHGLIRKSRKGRQIFVSVSERGSIFYDKAKRKKLLDIINKHKE